MSADETRVLLYGSCVSRDMFEYLGEGYTLLGYTARQSILSTMTQPLDMPADPELPSPFQQRMVRDDFRSSIAEMLPARAGEIDLLVIDLVDERLGVLALPDGGYLTRSQELLDSGLVSRLPGPRRIPFGTKEHFTLWRPVALEFVELLRRAGLLERTLLIEATFSARTDAGKPANMWWRKPASVWNRRYAQYYDVLRSAGIRTHVIGDDAVSSSTHQWGPAAYHYVDEAYLAITRTITDMARGDEGERFPE